MKNWIEPSPVFIPDGLEAVVGGHQLVIETLVRRGIKDIEAARAFLDPAHFDTSSPLELPGMEAAVERVAAAITGGESVCVWGDFDVDGQTATTLLVSALRDLGGKVSYHIPVRARESHGINLPVLEDILNGGIDLLLTCDTGIAAIEPVAHAQHRGVDVVVTDHHALPPELPPAYALVNPRLTPEDHPLATLPGVGVAYKLAEALYDRAGRKGEIEQYLDLVALGIVADVATIRGDTRYLLQRGLEVLRHPQRLGLKVLMELAELDPTWLTEEHIGFVIGPRLNALGRLADANPIVEFLTTVDIGRARLLAHELEGLNARRKLLTDQVFQGALSQINRDPSLLDYAVLVLAHPYWPAGVIGIVASRLVERFNKPVILIAAPPGETARGSARSVEGVNITAAISTHQEMLLGFGGHPMAAGLAIEPDLIPEFRRALSRTVAEDLGDVPTQPTLSIDGYIPFSDLSLDLVAELERLAPFGAGNPPLVLASQGLHQISHQAVGRSKEHILVTVEDDSGNTQKVVWWGGSGLIDVDPIPGGKFDLAYRVRASTFRGQRDIQLEWVDASLVEREVVDVREEREIIEVVDYRDQAHPLPVLERLQSAEPIQIWSEAGAKRKLSGRGRDELQPGGKLVIWTTPPGPGVLQEVLERVSPNKVYLFGINPGLDKPEAFLERLAGLVKYAIKSKEGKARLTSLASATAQIESVVELGLAWLEAEGHIRIIEWDDDHLRISGDAADVMGDSQEIAVLLKGMLDEVAAYRTYFNRTQAASLMNIVDD